MSLTVHPSGIDCQFVIGGVQVFYATPNLPDLDSRNAPLVPEIALQNQLPHYGQYPGAANREVWMQLLSRLNDGLDAAIGGNIW